MKRFTLISIITLISTLMTSFSSEDYYKKMFVGLPYSENKKMILEFIKKNSNYQLFDSFNGNYYSSYRGKIVDVKNFNPKTDSIRFFLVKGYELDFEGNIHFETLGTTVNYSYRTKADRDSEFIKIIKNLDTKIGGSIQTILGDETSNPIDRMEGFIYKLTQSKFPQIGIYKTTEMNLNELVIEYRKEIKVD